MKTNLTAFYGTNREEAENGKWLEVAPDVMFKIRKANSKAAIKERRKLEAPFNGKIPSGMQEELGMKSLAHAIVVDWRGVEIDGNQQEFSPELLLTMLKDMPDLAETLASFSIDENNFRPDDADLEKN